MPLPLAARASRPHVNLSLPTQPGLHPHSYPCPRPAPAPAPAPVPAPASILTPTPAPAPPLPLPLPQPPAPAPAPAPSAPPCLQHHSEVCPWSHHGLHEPLGRVRLAKMGTQLRHLLGAPASAAAAANTDATAHHTRYELSLQIPERLLMMMMMMKAYTIIIEVVKGLLLLLLVVVKGQSIACFS